MVGNSTRNSGIREIAASQDLIRRVVHVAPGARGVGNVHFGEAHDLCSPPLQTGFME
jgi:hypothetical protein